MDVKYRILQELNPSEEWETIGVITYWKSDPPHLQLRGIVQHTVSTAIWSKVMKRAKEQMLTLENYHNAFGEDITDYRLLPEIHTITGETASEIRQSLRKKYLFSPASDAVPA